MMPTALCVRSGRLLPAKASCQRHPVRGVCVQTQAPLQTNDDVILAGPPGPDAHSVLLTDFIFPPCYLVCACVVA